MFQKCFENDSKVFFSLSVLKLFVCIEVITATRALGGLVNKVVTKCLEIQEIVFILYTFHQTIHRNFDSENKKIVVKYSDFVL